MLASAQEVLFQTPAKLRDEEEFREWLEKEVSLGQRSAGDVVSRVKRVMSFLDVLAPLSDHELRFRLEECSAYRECSQSVRSQLKRASQLYRQFRRPRGARAP